MTTHPFEDNIDTYGQVAGRYGPASNIYHVGLVSRRENLGSSRHVSRCIDQCTFAGQNLHTGTYGKTNIMRM